MNRVQEWAKTITGSESWEAHKKNAALVSSMSLGFAVANPFIGPYLVMGSAFGKCKNSEMHGKWCVTAGERNWVQKLSAIPRAILAFPMGFIALPLFLVSGLIALANPQFASTMSKYLYMICWTCVTCKAWPDHDVQGEFTLNAEDPGHFVGKIKKK